MFFLANFADRFSLLRAFFKYTSPSSNFEKTISAADFAQKFGLKRRIIFSYEKGEVKPSFDVLIKLADYFCVSIDYLIGRSDDPEWAIHLPRAENLFFNHLATWTELIKLYKNDKAANPISLAPVFLRSYEYIREEDFKTF